ncbi:hypothetical protein, partial [Paraburkholderia heleia]|uniref:hypothetical protein n=1 Tax=Paraburkholderia heleia TaxID=634127 RepID=UPI002AB64C6E
ADGRRSGDTVEDTRRHTTRDSSMSQKTGTIISGRLRWACLVALGYFVTLPASATLSDPMYADESDYIESETIVKSLSSSDAVRDSNRGEENIPAISDNSDLVRATMKSPTSSQETNTSAEATTLADASTVALQPPVKTLIAPVTSNAAPALTEAATPTLLQKASIAEPVIDAALVKANAMTTDTASDGLSAQSTRAPITPAGTVTDVGKATTSQDVFAIDSIANPTDGQLSRPPRNAVTTNVEPSPALEVESVYEHVSTPSTGSGNPADGNEFNVGPGDSAADAPHALSSATGTTGSAGRLVRANRPLDLETDIGVSRELRAQFDDLSIATRQSLKEQGGALAELATAGVNGSNASVKLKLYNVTEGDDHKVAISTHLPSDADAWSDDGATAQYVGKIHTHPVKGGGGWGFRGETFSPGDLFNTLYYRSAKYYVVQYDRQSGSIGRDWIIHESAVDTVRVNPLDPENTQDRKAIQKNLEADIFSSASRFINQQHGTLHHTFENFPSDTPKKYEMRQNALRFGIKAMIDKYMPGEMGYYREAVDGKLHKYTVSDFARTDSGGRKKRGCCVH